MPSNQGRDIDQLFEDVKVADMEDASGAMWTEVHGHPSTSSCICPAVEVLARLYELGYRVVRS